jgi:hypothetical protein
VSIRPEFGDVVAREDFFFLFPDGRRENVCLKIGIPCQVQEGDWACPCELEGFEPRYPDIRGETSLQTLCLTIRLIRLRLADFQKKGGKVCFPGIPDEPLNAEDISLIFGGLV